MAYGAKQDRWRRATEWPLTAGAVLFLVVYAWDVLADLDPPDDAIPATISWIVWSMFLVDYLARLALANDRRRWFLRHLLELLVVLLPLLRPLRLLRLVPLLTILQRTAGETLRGRVVVYTSGSSILLVVIAALAVLDVERDAADARITSFSDALWWAVATLTSVGYGDEFPVTGTGRIIGVAVMVAGLALLGTVTATLASLFLGELAADQEQSRAATRSDILDLEKEVTRLQELAREQQAPGGGSDSDGMTPRRRPSEPIS